MATNFFEGYEAFIEERRRRREEEQRRQEAEQQKLDEQARRAKIRKRLESERDKADAALTRLTVDAAKNPDRYPEGAYESARDELVAERDRARSALAELDAEESRPKVEDLRPIVVGLLDECDTLTVKERNMLLRRLLRRVALVKDADGADAVELHPVWEPDPWATAEEQRLAELAA